MLTIGDKVVCINAGMLPHTVEELSKDCPNWIKEGKVYTVRGFADYDFVTGIYLEEITNPLKYFRLVGKAVEPAFRIDRFRKIDDITITSEASMEEEILTSHII